SPFSDIVIYGEWAGPNIQKKVSVSQIPKKTFFVFGALFVSENRMLTCPYTLQTALKSLTESDDRVRILPWALEPRRFDPSDEEALREFADLLNAEVAKIDQEDPYILEEFGVSGPGEGLVVSPIHIDGDPSLVGYLTRDHYSAMTFKVKGANHTVTKADKPARVKSFVSAEVKELASHFLTPARFDQAIQEALGGEVDIRRTPDFMKWIGADVKKESVAELEAAGLEWKDISKHVNHEAARWFRQKCAEVSAQIAA
ncbi:MAG: hypothetical protein JJ979_25070, partial [Roseibium sp.]|nr:hypothetical protein [Roseibium sp.]